MKVLHTHLSGSRKVPPVSTTLVAANTERCLAEVGRDFLVHAISLLLQDKCIRAQSIHMCMCQHGRKGLC